MRPRFFITKPLFTIFILTTFCLSLDRMVSIWIITMFTSKLNLFYKIKPIKEYYKMIKWLYTLFLLQCYVLQEFRIVFLIFKLIIYKFFFRVTFFSFIWPFKFFKWLIYKNFSKVSENARCWKCVVQNVV